MDWYSEYDYKEDTIEKVKELASKIVDGKENQLDLVIEMVANIQFAFDNSGHENVFRNQILNALWPEICTDEPTILLKEVFNTISEESTLKNITYRRNCHEVVNVDFDNWELEDE